MRISVKNRLVFTLLLIIFSSSVAAEKPVNVSLSAAIQPSTWKGENLNGGTDFEAKVMGAVHFTLDGQDFSLISRSDPDKGDLFIMFRDTTNSAETYGSGRYLSVDVQEGGEAIIDFNRAYNPPCAFTPYATCPLPPTHNNLPIAIAAGEKI